MKKYTDYNKHKKVLLDKYKNVTFSDDFYKRFDSPDYDYTIEGMKLVFFDKLNNFDIFFEKYNPIGIRIINDIDVYEKAKKIYDDIIKGDLFVDKTLHDPDNTLKNALQLMHIDEINLKNK